MTAITKATRACIVREAILDGYGVEDIVVRHGITAQEVRFEVEMLRENRTLRKPKSIFADRAREIQGYAE